MAKRKKTPNGCHFFPRNETQIQYVTNIQTSFVTFGIGAAGSGKTFCAVATALQTLFEHQVSKIVLTRPAVEAGESLGYLPGELQDKIAPYLYPFFDATDELIGKAQRIRLIECGQLEVIPLAYMRGRTLNESIIILDEAQNATQEQIKMLLTRLGKKSKAVVNGDPTQIDLPSKSASGLLDAVKRLEGIEGISVTRFTASDVVRHKIVQEIIKAYQ